MCVCTSIDMFVDINTCIHMFPHVCKSVSKYSLGLRDLCLCILVSVYCVCVCVRAYVCLEYMFTRRLFHCVMMMAYVWKWG